MSKPVMLYHSCTTVDNVDGQLSHRSRCKGRWLILTKERGRSWYIQVQGENGIFDYDGWWLDSKDATLEQAIAEARRGACIDE